MIDISGVKVGDRVRLTRKNEDGSEDKAIFTVIGVRPPSAGILRSATNLYDVREWGDMANLIPPLPTKVGSYTPFVSKDPNTQPVWRLRPDGTWLSMSYWAGEVSCLLSLSRVEAYHRAGTLRYLDTGTPS